MPTDPNPFLSAEVLVPFGSALAGAVVGGVAAAFGSAWVGRRGVTREQRILMYNEMLPGILDRLRVAREGYRRDTPTIQKWLGPKSVDALVRAATIAGRRDRNHARQLANLANTYEALVTEFRRQGLDEQWIRRRDNSGWSPPAEEHLRKLGAQNNRGLAKADEFSAWLDRRLRGPW